jgi:phosphate transport system permease protein
MVLGAVAVTYHVPGLERPLRLSPDVLADLFLGRIARWNDARLVALNPGARLPDADVLVVHRADGSGTTYIFTDYLASVSADWAGGPGRGKDVRWPTGVGGQGNEGVAGQVKQTPGTIGYVETTYARQNRLPVAELRNRAGRFVAPTPESETAAAAASATLPDKLDYRSRSRRARGGAIRSPRSLGSCSSAAARHDPGAGMVRSALALDRRGVARALGYVPSPPCRAGGGRCPRARAAPRRPHPAGEARACRFARRAGRSRLRRRADALRGVRADPCSPSLHGELAAAGGRPSHARCPSGSDAWDPVRCELRVAPALAERSSPRAGLALATPLALGVAVYSAELAGPRVRGALVLAVDLLAAVPSVVYGLWGLHVLVPALREHVMPVLRDDLGLGRTPFFAGPLYGPSVLAASLVLAVMIVPFVAAVAREVLRAVPASQREAAFALGATRWEAAVDVVVPYAASGIVGGVMLGLGRALGETIAVAMVVGGAHGFSASLLAPGYTLAALVANEFGEASDDLHLAALMAAAGALFAVTLVVNAVARWLVGRVARQEGDA